MNGGTEFGGLPLRSLWAMEIFPRGPELVSFVPVGHLFLASCRGTIEIEWIAVDVGQKRERGPPSYY